MEQSGRSNKDDADADNAGNSDTKDTMEARAEHEMEKKFKTVYGISSILGAVLAILMLVYCLHFRGGFAWNSQPKLQFNWHPLLMTFSIICLYSQSLLIYRTGRNLQKFKLKLAHMFLNLSAFILSVIGLKAAFDSHNYAVPPIPNLYTMHSWIGLMTIIIFAAEFVGGFTAFLFPGFSADIRKAILPIHTNLGKATFFFAVVSAMTGIMEKAIFSMPNYNQRIPEAWLVNFMGLILVLFGALILHLVHSAEYKRVALPEEEITLAEHNE